MTIAAILALVDDLIIDTPCPHPCRVSHQTVHQHVHRISMIFGSSYGVEGAANRVTTGVPSPTGALRISVYTVSVMPVVTAAGASVPRLKVHTALDPPVAAAAPMPPKRARTS